jgi:hypothetical protein
MESIALNEWRFSVAPCLGAPFSLVAASHRYPHLQAEQADT